MKNQRMRWILLLVLLLMRVTALNAQGLCVMDKKGNPISGVVVRGGGITLGYSDAMGRLPECGQIDTLHLSHLAFQTQTIILSQLATDRIELEPAVVKLKEVPVKKKKIACVYVRLFYRVYLTVENDMAFFDEGFADYFLYPDKKKERSRLMGNFNVALAPYLTMAESIPPNIGTLPMLQAFRDDSTYHFLPAQEGLQHILLHDSIVGTLSKADGQLLLHVDRAKINLLRKNITSKARWKNITDSKTLTLYTDNGTDYVSMRDFVSETNHWTSTLHKEGYEYLTRFVMDGYAVERDYLTSKEMKKKLKAQPLAKSEKKIEKLRQELGIPDLDGQVKLQLAWLKQRDRQSINNLQNFVRPNSRPAPTQQNNEDYQNSIGRWIE
ncbi:MAG: hypothetical protein IJ244_02205 [Bacteroidaceae bacterium]|nr:hypothetical protein [Bacteroidaceae bacterium]